MAKDAVGLIKNAEQKAYEIVTKAKADAQKMTEEAMRRKSTIIKEGLLKAENEIAKRERDIRKVCDEKIQTEIEAYMAENKKNFTDIEKKIETTASKLIPEIFM